MKAQRMSHALPFWQHATHLWSPRLYRARWHLGHTLSIPHQQFVLGKLAQPNWNHPLTLVRRILAWREKFTSWVHGCLPIQLWFPECRSCFFCYGTLLNGRQEVKCRLHSHFGSMKKLWKHISNFRHNGAANNGKSCNYPNRNWSRYALWHFKNCDNGSVCPVCCPVKRWWLIKLQTKILR